MKTKSCTSPECPAQNPQPITDFYNDRHNDDGKTTRCKICIKSYQKSEKGREVHRIASLKYYRTENGKKVYRKAAKRYQQSEKGKLAIKRGRERSKIKLKARQEVRNAIRNNILEPATNFSCSFCNEQANAYHHGNGYDEKNWLKVTPVCTKCHWDIHRPRMAEIAAARNRAKEHRDSISS